jgi:hypothetical protein
VDASKLIIYPNPTSNGVTIRLDMDKTVEVKITNVLGQSVYNGKMLQEAFISTDGWAAGMYLVRIGNNVVKKLIVQ